MTTYSILVTNNAPGCATEIEQQLSVTGCTSYIVRLASNSNALGPFNVYVDTVIYYSAQTRNEMLNGVVVTLECVTPSPTATPTLTPTPTQTDPMTVQHQHQPQHQPIHRLILTHRLILQLIRQHQQIRKLQHQQ